MRSTIGEPSVLLWVASALIALIGARTFVEFLRRMVHDGPVRAWRELLFGGLALSAGWWAAMIIDVAAQGMPFEIGYHPLKIFGVLLAAYAAAVIVLAWLSFRPAWPSQLSAAVAATVLAVLTQVVVLWSIGAEPGLSWRREPLVFAALLVFIGVGVSGRMVLGTRRGAKGDRGGRRLLAALVLGACIVGAQELVINASGLDRQVVSAHARFLPEVAITLVAGAVVPIGLILLFVDQRTQQRARAAERRRRRRSGEDASETMAGDSLLAGMPDSRHRSRS